MSMIKIKGYRWSFTIGKESAQGQGWVAFTHTEHIKDGNENKVLAGDGDWCGYLKGPHLVPPQTEMRVVVAANKQGLVCKRHYQAMPRLNTIIHKYTGRKPCHYRDVSITNLTNDEIVYPKDS